ncbi:MAG: VWA domain-containing protein [Vicinamibacterales bacterium]
MRATVVLTLAMMLPANAAWAQATERTVYASVVDKNDAPVPAVAAREFAVREDDTAREVLRVATATEPMQIAVLVDTSQAMEEHLLDVRNALRALFKQIGGEHEIALIGLGERPTVLSDYTRDPARLDKAIGSVFSRSGSGTYILDAIVEAANGLQRRKATRPHIIVYASKGPEFSERSHDSVLDALRESGATLHTLMLNRPGAATGSREEQELAQAVADGTKLTGGRREDLLTPMALGDRLQSLARELENQYQVVYARPSRLVPPKTLEVTVKRPSVTVRARRIP